MADTPHANPDLAPREHARERRATLSPPPEATNTSGRAWVALTSIQWREAWKYGERAFRYCQLDVGHAFGALRDSPCNWPAPSQWQGTANRPDRHPMYRWPVIDTAATVPRIDVINLIAHDAYPTSTTGPKHPKKSTWKPDGATAMPHRHQNAANLIRQRRSAQRFDARARMPPNQLRLLLRALRPHGVRPNHPPFTERKPHDPPCLF